MLKCQTVYCHPPCRLPLGFLLYTGLPVGRAWLGSLQRSWSSFLRYEIKSGQINNVALREQKRSLWIAPVQWILLLVATLIISSSCYFSKLRFLRSTGVSSVALSVWLLEEEQTSWNHLYPTELNTSFKQAAGSIEDIGYDNPDLQQECLSLHHKLLNLNMTDPDDSWGPSMPGAC